MPVFTDQMQRKVTIADSPQRIVSLVPSQTELLFDLGLQDQIVGITKFCVHPKALCAAKTHIGGTKNFHFDRIEALKPDLIIGNKEENYQEGIDTLAKKYPVWMSDIFTLNDALQMMQQLSEITQTSPRAQVLIQQIKDQFEAFVLPDQAFSAKVAYFIWRKPYMVAGSQNFIDEMIKHCGWQNVFAHQPRYPVVNPEQLAAQSPDIILLSSEPYPFKQKHLEEFKQICPQAKVLLVDGELFSWYGSRLRLAPAYFGQLLNEVVV
ncbi:ABC transporter substrate-binding protein [Microscilla marina]|uniref:Periplasmic binding protein n=1 Tax=Microscilla marina ATCC 23134 TaxID=313606 RepID=A1ZTG3_MICM2|nr:helical backbone metal receptor [Microscilla marina]EAY26385.1 periplasmic binding protein [Microscilla marina ATCC 23134]